MGRCFVLTLCVLAIAPGRFVAQHGNAPHDLEAYVRDASVIVVADVEKFRSELLGKNSATPLNTQRNTLRVIEWIKAPAGTPKAATVDLSQCTDAVDCHETPLQMAQRYVLFLDRWAAAGDYSTTYGDITIWPVGNAEVTLPAALTGKGGSFEGTFVAPLDVVLKRVREAAAAVAQSPLSAADRELIDAYRSSIQNAAAGRDTATDWIESAFAAFGRVRERLLAVEEKLTVSEFNQLNAELPGIALGRDEIVIAEPDIDYFVVFAAGHGTDIDRAFVAALKETYSNPVWPVYLQQQTDYSGCIRFGTGTLVDAYRRWTEFARQHPGRFAVWVRKYTDDVVKHLTASTCACGSSADVERELSRFVTEFPSAPERASVESRLAAVRTNRAGIRANCKSG